MTHWRSPNAGCSWPETPPGSQQTTRQRSAHPPVPDRCRGLSSELAKSDAEFRGANFDPLARRGWPLTAFEARSPSLGARNETANLARSAPVLPITGTGTLEASQGTDGKTVPINSDMELAMWIFLGLFLGGISFAFALIYLLLVSQL